MIVMRMMVVMKLRMMVMLMVMMLLMISNSIIRLPQHPLLATCSHRPPLVDSSSHNEILTATSDQIFWR